MQQPPRPRGTRSHRTFFIGIAALYVLLASVGVVIVRSSRQHASPASPTPAPPGTAQPEVSIPGTQNPPLAYCPHTQQLRIVPTHGRQFTYVRYYLDRIDPQTGPSWYWVRWYGGYSGDYLTEGSGSPMMMNGYTFPVRIGYAGTYLLTIVRSAEPGKECIGAWGWYTVDT